MCTACGGSKLGSEICDSAGDINEGKERAMLKLRSENLGIRYAMPPNSTDQKQRKAQSSTISCSIVSGLDSCFHFIKAR